MPKLCKLKEDGYLYPYSDALAADKGRFDVVDVPDAPPAPLGQGTADAPPPVPPADEEIPDATTGPTRKELFATASALGLKLAKNIPTEAMIAKIAEAESAANAGN